MSTDETALVYIATYTDPEAASVDYEVVTRLYAGGVVHRYNATVISRGLDGKLSVVTAAEPELGRAWIGLAAGTLLRRFCPPLLPGHGQVSAAGDGVTMKHLWRGLSRGDVKTIANMLRDCAAVLIVISETTLQGMLRCKARGTFREFEKARTSDDDTFALDLRRDIDQWPGAA